MPAPVCGGWRGLLGEPAFDTRGDVDGHGGRGLREVVCGGGHAVILPDPTDNEPSVLGAGTVVHWIRVPVSVVPGREFAWAAAEFRDDSLRLGAALRLLVGRVRYPVVELAEGALDPAAGKVGVGGGVGVEPVQDADRVVEVVACCGKAREELIPGQRREDGRFAHGADSGGRVGHFEASWNVGRMETVDQARSAGGAAGPGHPFDLHNEAAKATTMAR